MGRHHLHPKCLEKNVLKKTPGLWTNTVSSQPEMPPQKKKAGRFILEIYFGKKS